MGDILTALRRARATQDGNSEMGRYVYESMMEDIKAAAREDARAELADARAKATAEARADVAAEISNLREAANTAKVDANTARAEIVRLSESLKASDASLKEARKEASALETRIASLRKQVLLEQQSLSTEVGGHAAAIQSLKDELSAEREKNAKLEGEAKALRKKAPPPAPIVQPSEPPEFEITNVVFGGPSNRIVSATVKPVRTN